MRTCSEGFPSCLFRIMNKSGWRLCWRKNRIWSSCGDTRDSLDGARHASQSDLMIYKKDQPENRWVFRGARICRSADTGESVIGGLESNQSASLLKDRLCQSITLTWACIRYEKQPTRVATWQHLKQILISCLDELINKNSKKLTKLDKFGDKS